ncbi:MAG: EAL domain-containing protein [Gammaproteobacteria bacterium]|nr:EAL domain-containing protein [Gammaproteobacteria bacterium]
MVMAGSTTNKKGSDLLFVDSTDHLEEDSSSFSYGDLRWKVLIIDDEKVVHEVSQLVLKDFSYKQRGLELIHGYTGEDARQLIKKHPDTAIMLLDVVMESDSAGLDTVRYIREELQNRTVRIILRTGQPGQAPEHKVIRFYDINDYLDKSRITAEYLERAMITSLRSYDDICTIGQLTASNDTLEALVKARTLDLSAANDMLQQKIKQQIEANAALQRSEARLAEAQRVARIGHFEWSFIDDSMQCSDQVYRILEIPTTDSHCSLTEFMEMVVEEDRDFVRKTMSQAAGEGVPYDIEHRMRQSSGNTRYLRHQGDIITDAGHGDKCIVGTLQDITEQRLAEFEMRKLSAAVEQTADGIMITDSDGIIEYVNPAMIEITGYSKDELIGQTPSVMKSGKQSDAFYQRLWKTILQGSVFNEVIINRHKSGRLYFEEKTITPQKNQQGEIISYISSGKDITERMEAQERLHHLAHHDSLTGLPNRMLLQDRLDQALKRAQWRQRTIAVMFIDMDRFKLINDTLGHSVGDLVLIEMALRLSGCVREDDTVARFGGDEFAIILNDINSIGDIPGVANKILSSLAAVFECEGRELFVTSSIGISLFPEDGDNSHTLLKKADAAMYQAKRKGRNAFQFYTEANEQPAIERLTLESSLRRALERDEFRLYYQPQLNLTSCKIDGYEALLRWQHPEQGLLPPVNFIPLLEETGMIISVGEWVLHTACTQEKASRKSGRTAKKVAVNISIHQFRQKDFTQMVERTLASTGLEAQYLELEVTEGVLIDDMKETAAKLHELHNMGISLSIDDFGTGYSSMNYLKRLPFNLLKIDRSFVTDITTSSDDASIAAAIITLAHSIGLEVTAEGVETTEQLSFLDQLGCDSIQGYLCSPPLPADAFTELDEDQYHDWKDYLSRCDR